MHHLASTALWIGIVAASAACSAASLPARWNDDMRRGVTTSRAAAVAAAAASSSPTLRELARHLPVFVGSSTPGHSGLLNGSDPADPTYGAIMAQQYNMHTVAELYWAESEPEPGVFHLAPALSSAKWAARHNQTTRCHNLVWHQSLPGWVNSTLSHAQLAAALQRHVTTIVTALRGMCGYYDVVNEPLNNDGSLRDTLWRQALGDDYIATVLGWVHAADPDARLVLNDFGIEEVNAKSDGMLALFTSLRGRSPPAPLHSIGFESHFILADAPNLTSVEDNMARFIAAGAEVQVTELDVSLNGTETSGKSVADRFRAQGAFFGMYADVCLRHMPAARGGVGCSAIVTWDFTDRYSWLGMLELDPVSTWGGYSLGPLPFGANLYGPKPAFQSLANALRNASAMFNSVTAAAAAPAPTSAPHPDAAVLREVVAASRSAAMDAGAADADRLTRARYEAMLDAAGSRVLPRRRHGYRGQRGAGGDGMGLGDWGKLRGIYMGAAEPGRAHDLSGAPPRTDPDYAPLLASQYSMVTAAELYWSEVEPVEGQFNFAPVDAAIAFAAAHGQKVRCHNLVWYRTLPAWVNASLSPARLRSIMLNHVTRIATHLKGKCYAYDVVNEPLAMDGSPRASLWYNAYNGSTAYINAALAAVHAVDPAAKLFVNDYMVEQQGTGKGDALYELCASLLKAGAPLHGVGFESHLMAIMGGANLTAVGSNMARYAGTLGLELHVTEFDYTLDGIGGSIASRWRMQADFYGRYLALCLAHKPSTWGAPGCAAWVQWSFDDRDSWLGEMEDDPVSTNAGYMFAPLPYDATYCTKPAYAALKATLTNPPEGA